MTFAQDRNLEREAIVDERAFLRDALTRSMGEHTLADLQGELTRRIDAGEVLTVEQGSGAPGRAFTTPAMQVIEHDTIAIMRAGRDTQRLVATGEAADAIARDHAHLSESQRAAVQQILASRDQVMALEGVAGAGKTTALSAVRDAAERAGYRVEGFAPTSRAAHQLNEAGIPSTTLQHHLSWRNERHDQHPRYYVLDESSLASTVQMNAFLHRLQSDDRVLLVGDVRQHQSVDAGRPYEQLQEAGIATARLTEIVRQKDPALKTVVDQLARGDVDGAIARLETQGRVHEIADRRERFQRIAREYARQPDGTLVVSPDNESRTALNQVIHHALQDGGRVERREHRTRVLVPRQEITGADRRWAERYEPGDVVRYTKGSEALGLQAGDYARVERTNATRNLLTVARENGECITYDPRRLQGVTIYREAERALANGDRVQFTAPDRALHIANRELGTIDAIEPSGDLRLRLDSGRTVAFNVKDHPHVDYGYAVTSHSSQGQTTDRVLVHVETARAGESLVNQRMAYVALSRGRHDAQIYTDSQADLARALGREVSHASALQRDGGPELGMSR